MSRLRKLKAVVLFIYPLYCFAIVWIDRPQWITLYLGLLCAILLVEKISERKWLGVAVWILVGIVLIQVTRLELTDALMRLLPVIIISGIFLAFSTSLKEGAVPLVTRVATIIDGELNEKQYQYTVRVTWFWTGLLFFILLQTIGVAMWASNEVWSFVTNVLNYILIIGAMMLEYVYRRKHNPELRSVQTFSTFIDSLRKIQLASGNK